MTTAKTVTLAIQQPPPVEPAASLWAALCAAQAAIGSIVRDAEGQARAGKYRYATLEVVIDAVRPGLNAQGLVLMQPTILDGDRVLVATRIVHAATGECVECVYPAGPASQPHQQLGAGVTYARRYSLMALLGVAPEDDDGASAGVAAQPMAKPQPSKHNAVSGLLKAIQNIETVAECDTWANWHKAEGPRLLDSEQEQVRKAWKHRRAALAIAEADKASDMADEAFPGDLP